MESFHCELLHARIKIPPHFTIMILDIWPVSKAFPRLCLGLFGSYPP